MSYIIRSVLLPLIRPKIIDPILLQLFPTRNICDHSLNKLYFCQNVVSLQPAMLPTILVGGGISSASIDLKGSTIILLTLDYHTFLSENLQEERRGHLNISRPSRILKKMEIFPLGGTQS